MSNVFSAPEKVNVKGFPFIKLGSLKRKEEAWFQEQERRQIGGITTLLEIAKTVAEENGMGINEAYDLVASFGQKGGGDQMGLLAAYADKLQEMLVLLAAQQNLPAGATTMLINSRILPKWLDEHREDLAVAFDINLTMSWDLFSLEAVEVAFGITHKHIVLGVYAEIEAKYTRNIERKVGESSNLASANFIPTYSISDAELQNKKRDALIDKLRIDFGCDISRDFPWVPMYTENLPVEYIESINEFIGNERTRWRDEVAPSPADEAADGGKALTKESPGSVNGQSKQPTGMESTGESNSVESTIPDSMPVMEMAGASTNSQST